MTVAGMGGDATTLETRGDFSGANWFRALVTVQTRVSERFSTQDQGSPTSARRQAHGPKGWGAAKQDAPARET